MTENSEKKVVVDPKEGDAILKRMLQTKPKLHKDMKKGKGVGRKDGATKSANQS